MTAKVLLVVLAMSRNNYPTEKDFMKEKHYTVAHACEVYKATDCELRVERTVYCMGEFGEGACDKWMLWGRLKK